jgi:hypothetical protein
MKIRLAPRERGRRVCSGVRLLQPYAAKVRLAIAGKNAEALRVIGQLQKVSKQNYVSSYGLAEIYAALGDKQHAMKWLQPAYDEGAVDAIP